MNYNEWFKKNWFTVLAIFIIIVVVIIHQSRIQSIVNENVRECTEKLEKCIIKVEGNSYELPILNEEISNNWDGTP